MKNVWKLLAAAAALCLPLAFTACSSDSDDDTPRGPQTYAYTWALVDGIDLNKLTIENQETVIEARKSINNLVVEAYTTTQQFIVDSKKQQFAITLPQGGKIDPYDELVEETFLTMKRTNADFQAAAAKLPAAAKLVIRRDENIIVNRTLRQE